MDLGIFFFCSSSPLQTGKSAEKTPAKPCDIETYEKKIRLLEKQRKDVSLNGHFFWFLLILFLPFGKVALSVVSYVLTGCLAFALPLAGSGGEQAVGHSVELHEVTV